MSKVVIILLSVGFAFLALAPLAGGYLRYHGY